MIKQIKEQVYEIFDSCKTNINIEELDFMVGVLYKIAQIELVEKEINDGKTCNCN